MVLSIGSKFTKRKFKKKKIMLAVESFLYDDAADYQNLVEHLLGSLRVGW